MKANRINQKKYNRLVLITIIAVYLLILAGGIVRSTGSGMGCPDWPKCFGSWVPPTSESQLPKNYQASFSKIRVEKNQRLAAYLEIFGLKGLAEALKQESIATPEEVFNKYKTWTEYINRLMGVVVGMLITIMAVISVKFRKEQPVIFYGSIGAFLLVAFQGWVGSVVVSTNLLPGLVTFHMVLAALLIGLLVFLFHHSSDNLNQPLTNGKQTKILRLLLISSMCLLLLQVVLGSQVREAVDIIAVSLGSSARDQWIDNLGGSFYLHRSLSLLILAVNVYLYYLLVAMDQWYLLKMARILLYLILAEIALGAYMAYFSIPAWAQPLHLLSALGLVGLQFWLFLKTKSLQQT